MTNEQKQLLGNAIITLLESTGMTLEESVNFLSGLVETGTQALAEIRRRGGQLQ
jgi:hypothetical protein